MAYSTDRQVVERLLIPAMLQVLVTVMRQDLGEDADVLDPVADLLNTAMREPIDGVHHADKLVRRAKRATSEVMTTIADQAIGIQYLAIADFTVDLSERDYFVIGSDSAFARAWNLMAKVMDLVLDELKSDKAAVETAVVLRRCLNARGFFREV